jgi:hypothetical protein
MVDATPKELRAAQVAHTLARAVRDGDVNSIKSHLLSVRSSGAQASIEKHAPERPHDRSEARGVARPAIVAGRLAVCGV